MSDQGKVAATPEHREIMAESHAKRAQYETLIINCAMAIVVAAAVILLFGVAYPPPLDTKFPDWGRAIVDRMKEAALTLGVLFGLLVSLFGLSQARGGYDAKISAGG